MNENDKPRFSLTMWIVLGVVLAIFGILTCPVVIRSKRNGVQTEAVSNARQIGLALFEFDTAYGQFPDERTAAKIRQKTGNRFNLGSASSNDYFRQLMAAEIASSETLFYAKTRYTKRPDNITVHVDKALAYGEVGFGYLMDGKTALSSRGNPARPLVCTPLALDNKTVSNQFFDSSIDDGKVVVLRIDNSAQSLPIDIATRRAMLGGGKYLLDTGEDTVWGASAKPVIVPPLPKP